MKTVQELDFAVSLTDQELPSDLVAMCQEFVERGKDRPQEAFADLPLLGYGRYSEVRAAGDLAIKISTPNTGKTRFPGAPENLTNQAYLLKGLGHWLDDKTGGGIQTPEQHKVLKTNGGNVLIQENMIGWSSLRQVLIAKKANPDHPRYKEITEVVRERIASALYGLPLLMRAGLDDVYSAGGLNPGNVLVSGEYGDPATAPLCLIDQPNGNGTKGRVATLVARKMLKS